MDDFITYSGVLAFIMAALRAAVPVAFAALGAMLAERSGVYNVGLEGSMLLGAFAAAAATYATGSAALGAVAGLVLGAGLGIVQAFLTVTMRSNQLVSGIAINLFCVGITAYFGRLVFGASQDSLSLPGFGPLKIPLLGDIPLIGPTVFQQDVLAYLLILCIVVSAWVMTATHAGLALRATGENPRAADSAGVPVPAVRYLAVTLSSALAALGGSHLVLSQVHMFSENMSGGRGFLALAIVILGRWKPVWIGVAALFFGACEAVQLTLQFANPSIPYQLFLILPYVASIAAMVGLGSGARAPEAVGRPYDRESR